MESLRLVSVVVLCVSLFLLGEKWVEQFKGAENTKVTDLASAVNDVPSASPSVQPALPTNGSKDAGGASSPRPSAEAGSPPSGTVITVETDLLRAEISTIGGEIRRIELLQQKDTLDASRNFVLLEPGGRHTYLAQNGLLGGDLPTHKAAFTASAEAVKLVDGQDVATVVLTQQDGTTGTRVVKTYRFRRAQYVVDVMTEVTNAPASIKPTGYFQLVRDDIPPEGDSRWVPTFNGVAVFTEKDKYQKIQFSDIAKGKASHVKTSADGWVAMVQHYFVAAWLPAAGDTREFFTRALGNGLFAAGVIVPMKAGAGDGHWTLEVPLYVGPQEQKKMEALAPGLQYTVDYGWLTVIATPLFWALASIQKLLAPNWGVAIILLTIAIKAIFFPLSAASYKSMAKMRVLGPRLQKLKEQFGDDRQKLHQAMMEMYKTEKINPLGGCLPIVVQIPVFIALYWVLLGSVEMRHAPFVLWIKDLSSPDPFYVLPVLMGLSMIIQTRLNPEPPDPIQAKVMKIMPVAFSVFFFFFPAGLVLYWLVNNILSIGQQWYITRKLEQAGLATKRR
jgi:YidC/Oxa1 family membrane protein insertase